MFGMAGLADEQEYLPFLCTGLIDRIVKVAVEMYSRWMKGDKSAIHPDLRSAVFAIAIKNGGKEEVCSHSRGRGVLIVVGGIV